MSVTLIVYATEIRSVSTFVQDFQADSRESMQKLSKLSSTSCVGYATEGVRTEGLFSYRAMSYVQSNLLLSIKQRVTTRG